MAMLLLAALATIVFVVQPARAADPTPPSRWRRLKGLTEECAFTMGRVSYDLCPVFGANEGGYTVEFEERTPPTFTKTQYYIDLKGPLKKDESVPWHDQCPGGTWICQIVSNRRPTHKEEEPRVLRTVPVAGAMNLTNIPRYRPGVNVSAELTNPDNNPKLPASVLHIRLHGGYYVNGPQKADFRFFCDTSAEEPTTPTHAWSWNGTHTFNWRTRHACGSMRATPSPPSDKDTPPPDEDTAPPTDDENAPGSPDELIDGHGLRGRWLGQTSTILLLSTCTALVGLAYAARHPPARVRHAVARFVKAHPRVGRWRVKETVLVRWAYEDMELAEGYGGGDGEEDVMVNFAIGEDGEDGVGEAVPLKPSPRKGPWTSYGTA